MLMVIVLLNRLYRPVVLVYNDVHILVGLAHPVFFPGPFFEHLVVSKHFLPVSSGFRYSMVEVSGITFQLLALPITIDRINNAVVIKKYHPNYPNKEGALIEIAKNLFQPVQDTHK